MLENLKNQTQTPAYEKDFYGWTIHQVNLLKEHRLDEIDIPNIIEEIESLGRSEKRELISLLAVLIGHLLKWQYQSEKRSNSWIETIEEQREELAELLEENPSFQSILTDSLDKAYRKAVKKASKETKIDISIFPSNCPYTFEQTIDKDFYPDQNSK